MSLKNKLEALDILKQYQGKNPYILMLQRNILYKGEELTDFNAEYIISNHCTDPLPINKIIKLADWYQIKKQEDWGLEFLPEKLSIKWLLGETSSTYHCYVKYRQNMEPIQAFLPKRAVLTNFLISDYKEVKVDFDRYDLLSTQKDKNRRLRPHQKEGVQFLLSRKKCVLADDMGYGKTTTLSVAAIEGNFDSVLIICPASIKTTWKRELMWYVPERDITIVEGIQGKTKKELEIYLGYGEGKSGKKVADLQQEAKERGKWVDNRFVIINFDILDEVYKIPQTRSKENISNALEQSPMLQYLLNRKSLIIIDEAHKLSDMSSIRYKIIRDLVKRAQPNSIYAATGTPITNNPQNFYCVLQFLGDPITDDYNYYMERYCDAKKFPRNGEEKEKRNRISDNFIQSKGKRKWYELTDEEKDELNKLIERNVKMITVANGASNLDELKERVSHIYLRRIKEDLQGLPDKKIHEVHYELTQQQQIEYNKLWEEYEMDQYKVDPTKELNKNLLEGAIYRKYLSNEMVPYTIKLTQSLVNKGEKVVIGCCFDEELYTLRDYFGESCVIYNGKMNAKEKDIAVAKFMDDPNTMVFIGNIQSCGVGITLISSCNMVLNTFSYSNADNKQMEDRIYRIGQNRNVNVYYQMFKQTRCEDVWNICLRKDLLSKTIIKKESEK